MGAYTQYCFHTASRQQSSWYCSELAIAAMQSMDLCMELIAGASSPNQLFLSVLHPDNGGTLLPSTQAPFSQNPQEAHHEKQNLLDA
jgi:hypothetical protein